MMFDSELKPPELIDVGGMFGMYEHIPNMI